MNIENHAPAQGASQEPNTAMPRLHNVHQIHNTRPKTTNTARQPGKRRQATRYDQVDTYPQLLHDFDLVFEAYVTLLVQYSTLFLELSDGRQDHLLQCELPFHFCPLALQDIHTAIEFKKRGCSNG